MGHALVLLVALAVQGAPATPGPAPLERRVAGAVEAHIEARLGGDADAIVTLERWPAVASPGPGEPRIAGISIDPAARVGQALRAMVRLEWPGGRTRFVPAHCDVRVIATHWRTTRALARAAVVAESDVERVTGDVGRVALAPLPEDVVGGRMRRTLPEGVVVAGRDVAPLPLVASGEMVRVRVARAGLEVEASAVASQTGDFGEVIRVVNPDSGRALRARVVGRREVEVVDATRN